MALMTLALAACRVAADECDTQGALERLQTEVVGELDEKQAERAEKILASLCAPTKEVESNKVLGFELRPADEDSEGHERLKRRGH